jgi:hypothetical protein
VPPKSVMNSRRYMCPLHLKAYQLSIGQLARGLRFLALALIRNLRHSQLDGGQYALARLPADPNPFQAARLHSALPACARRQAAFRAGLADENKFDRYRVIGCKDGERVRARYRLPDYHSKKEKNPAKRSSPGSG